MARERPRLARDALLQVAVAGDHVGEVVEGALALGRVGVEQLALEALRVREADGGCEALAERSGRDLDALGVAVLGVARCEGAPRAERLEVALLEARAGQVELDVLRQRGVADREDEAVTTHPLVVGRVAVHDLLEEQVRHGGQAHGRPGVAVADLLDGVGREHARGVDCLLVVGGPFECQGGSFIGRPARVWRRRGGADVATRPA